MSKIDNIKDKKVDFKVKGTTVNLSPTPDDKGVINVILNEEDNINALYIGDEHIASGYGFDEIKTKHELETLLKNPSIKKILYPEETEEPVEEEPSSAEIVTGESAITFNNTTITLSDDVLSVDSWLNIHNIEIVLSNGISIKNGESFEYSMLKDNLHITTIKLIYDISKKLEDEEEYNLYYRFNIKNYKTLNFNSPGANGLSDFGEEASFVIEPTNGEKNFISIPCDIELIKNNPTGLEYKQPISLLIYSNDDSTSNYYTYINLGSIIYKYPVYLTNLTDTLNINWDNSLYDINDGADVSISSISNLPIYIYVWVPSIIDNPVCIYKPSNIGCNTFVLDDTCNVNNITYKRYKSPCKYSGEMKWIIK